MEWLTLGVKVIQSRTDKGYEAIKLLEQYRTHFEWLDPRMG